MPQLMQVASNYGASITYEDLATALQDRTGYRTRMLLSNWIGQVLEVVLLSTLREDLAPLTSLVVLKDTGGVGDGYYNREHPQGTITDQAVLQRIAAEDRLACYRAFCEAVPDDAAPQMTELFQQKRATATPRSKLARPEQICPTCHYVLPLRGECDNCA